MDIAAANAGVFYLNNYIVGVGDFGNGPIFVGDTVGFRKDERGVLDVSGVSWLNTLGKPVHLPVLPLREYVQWSWAQTAAMEGSI